MTASAGERSVYHRPLLWMLALAYACNFMDRSVVGTLAQAIKVDLVLSDAQLGLLQGFAFVVLYCIAGLPFAWLAERRDRITIISICLALWSAMTMVCGLTANFGQLLLARVGVGVGEAGCNPCSHSMIADAFAAKERSRALSVYQLGATVGTMVGAMCAGAIAQHFGWRVAFLMIGAPGLLVALAMRVFMRDPGRAGAASVAGDAGIGVVLRQLAGDWTILHLVLGFTLASFAFAAVSAFNQPYFIRAFGLSVARIGLIFGLSGGVASAACLVLSGRMTDWAARRDARWHGLLPVCGLGLSVPCTLAAYTVGDWRAALAFTFMAGFCLNWFIIPTLAALHRLLGIGRVATGMALVLLFQNFAGLGAGPFVAGAVIDALARAIYGKAHAANFLVDCPAGQGAGAYAAACHGALTQATRFGLMATVLVVAWACVHYALAALSLRRAVAAVEQGPR